jgi:hypothetical protein
VFSLIYRSLEENETFSGNLGLKSKKKRSRSLRIERRRMVIDRTSVQAFKARIECTCVHVRKKEIDCSAIERTKGDRAHLCVKPTPAAALFWKFLVFRVLVTPC